MGIKSCCLALLILLLLLPLACFAEEFRFPFSCYPKDVQKQFAEYNKKLDLDGNDRTEDSWGFIENKGTFFKIYTYFQTTKEDKEIIRKVILEGDFDG